MLRFRRSLPVAALAVIVAFFATPGTIFALVEWDTVSGRLIYPDRTHSLSGHPPIPDFEYDEDDLGIADASYPSTTRFRIYDIGYWNGTNASGTLIFGATTIYDEQAENRVTKTMWLCTEIDGVDTYKTWSPTWDFDELDSENAHIVVAQKVADAPNGCFDAGLPFLEHGIFHAQ